MPGTISYAPPGIPVLDIPAPYIVVVRVNSAGDWLTLPNIRIVSDQVHEWTPQMARYRYEFDQDAGPDFPQRFDECFASSGFYVIGMDERIAAIRVLETGKYHVLADGYSVAPQVTASGEQEQVTVEVMGAPVRFWDDPIPGQLRRDGVHVDTIPDPASQDDAAVHDIQTDIPVRFNPDGRPNASIEGADSHYGTANFPVFVDVLIADRSPDVRRHWTLEMACRYIICQGLAKADKSGLDESIIQAPDLTELAAILTAMVPTDPAQPVNPGDPATFTTEPILCPDVEIRGETWPDALRKLIEPHGFKMRFEFDPDRDTPGRPVYRMVVYRQDDQLHVEQLKLQDVGQVLDAAKTNAPLLNIQRDGQLVNAFIAETGLVVFEIDAILAPLFEPDSADLDDKDTMSKFDSTDPRFTDGDNMNKYRLFGCAEAGDRYWDTNSGWVNDYVFDFGPAFHFRPVSRRYYARNRRPPLSELVRTDDHGNAMRPQLWITTQAVSTAPILFQMADPEQMKTIKWRQVTEGWKVADDRLGIYITIQQPWNWRLGDALRGAANKGLPFHGGMCNIMKSLAMPEAAPSKNQRFQFRLKCAVTSDIDLAVYAGSRTASPSKYEILRVDDLRDRCKKKIISVTSWTSGLPPAAPKVVIDDTKVAMAHACARRRTHEFNRFAGTAVIPWITSAYKVGDKISDLTGRGFDFNQMGGAQYGEPPYYPAVVSRDRVYEPQMGTTLHLTDRRAEPAAVAEQNWADTVKRAKRAPRGIPGAEALERAAMGAGKE